MKKSDQKKIVKKSEIKDKPSTIVNKTAYVKKSYLMGTNFRWIVPSLVSQKRAKKISKDNYKKSVLKRLLASKTAKKGLKHYCIALETHQDGSLHLDLLLVFDKRIRIKFEELDFLCGKHGDLTKYRSLNGSILEYGFKEDTPLHNLPEFQSLLNEQELKKDSYLFFQTAMLKDPFSFDLDDYCSRNDYFRLVKNYPALRSKLKLHQEAACNATLYKKGGIRLITFEFIRSTLTEDEFRIFNSWDGFCRIVTFINEITLYGSYRPFKSPNLLLVGRPNVGKTLLISTIAKYCATYEMGVSNWFPRYKTGIYSLIAWNQFRLNVMPYNNLLRFLEGIPMDLEYKGGSTLKNDNPLVVMTSNLSYERHISHKFSSYSTLSLYQSAMKNFPARVFELKIPEGYDLFLLLKLVQPV